MLDTIHSVCSVIDMESAAGQIAIKVHDEEELWQLRATRKSVNKKGAVNFISEK